MHYVYILLLNNGCLYTGSTADLKRRIEEHKLGKVRSTKNLLPLKLIHYEAYLLKKDALRRERYLKSSDGKRDIKRQLSSILKKLGLKQGSPRDKLGAARVHPVPTPAPSTIS